jgi:putative ABC transport system ATP-binding protein
MTAAPLIVIRNVTKSYGQGGSAVNAVRGVSLAIEPGEFVSITGPSGSGKSTLLNLVAGLDTATSGEVIIEDASISALSNQQLALVRRRTIAIIFQFFNLLPTLNAEENVAVPLRADGMKTAEVRARAARALEAVGLAERAKHYPSELSGGEMQRVAIARALATDARVILADEPTGNLDTERGEEILEMLRQACDRDGRAVVLVTHDVRAAAYGDRLITLRDGRIVDEVSNATRSARVVELSTTRKRRD